MGTTPQTEELAVALKDAAIIAILKGILPTGIDGKSAYQIWLDNGNTGNEGEFLQDLIGIDGADGIGVQIRGSKTLAEIQAIDGTLGDIYISTDAPIGHGWVSDGKTGAASWSDFGMFRGPKGDAGSGSGGGGIAQADQDKLNYITISSDLDLNTIDDNAKAAIKKVGDLNLDGSGTTLMTAKDVELAQKQVVPTDPVLALKDNRMITVASTIAAFNNMSVKVMMEKGIITDISGITETGIYEGTDVANSPMTGPIMVMANKDTNGDFGFFLMGADGALHTGGKAQLGKTFWTEIKAKAVAEGSIEVDAAYSGRFVSPNMDSFTGQSTHNLFDAKEHKVIFTDKVGNDWTTDKDPYAWYLRGGGKLGHFAGASGHVGSKVLEGWVKHKNIVTIQYTDATKKEFNVLKVEGDTQIGGSNHLVADGSVDMNKGYVPKNDLSIATKKFVLANGGSAPKVIELSDSVTRYDFTMADLGTPIIFKAKGAMTNKSVIFGSTTTTDSFSERFSTIDGGIIAIFDGSLVSFVANYTDKLHSPMLSLNKHNQARIYKLSDTKVAVLEDDNTQALVNFAKKVPFPIITTKVGLSNIATHDSSVGQLAFVKTFTPLVSATITTTGTNTSFKVNNVEVATLSGSGAKGYFYFKGDYNHGILEIKDKNGKVFSSDGVSYFNGGDFSVITDAKVSKLNSDTADVYIGTDVEATGYKRVFAPLFEAHPDGVGLVKGEYARDISTKHEHIFVTKGEVQKMIPPHPTADGDYKLNITAGVATWVTV